MISRRLRLAALACAAAIVAPFAAHADPSDVDPIVLAFAPELRAQLSRDNRCTDARVAADTFALDLTNGANAVAVINALEKCLALPRTPAGWEEYTSLLLTADAAATLAAARLSRSQRVYDRARVYAEHVPGYSLSLAGGHTMTSFLTRNGGSDPHTSGPPSDAPADPSGVVRYQMKNVSSASSGPAGLARIASEIGFEASHPDNLASPAASPIPRRQAQP